ncbi:hypothetical protein [Risungbinella massiliensis]|uniref:hypothetical protein n=1 Tax=Risungbinella massiliensis TaxID=1329796 RepID=UPI0005CC70F1|nr:hypothetical protein [Risungbinella massiliensis]
MKWQIPVSIKKFPVYFFLFFTLMYLFFTFTYYSWYGSWIDLIFPIVLVIASIWLSKKRLLVVTKK